MIRVGVAIDAECRSPLVKSCDQGLLDLMAHSRNASFTGRTMPHPRLPADFLDAMDRHWHDALLLENNGRTANADHLYGLSAECGLKALMRDLGMEMEADDQGRYDKPKNRGDQKHIDTLWNRYVNYQSGTDAIKYPLPREDDDSNPFDDWSIHQRYVHRNQFDADRLRRHRSGAECVKNLVVEARKEDLFHDHP